MSFERRLKGAVEHELAVLAKLQAEGWTASPFGQGQLPDEIRDVLRRKKTPLRWLPDILVVHKDGRPFLIDAKWATRSDTDNWSIEIASHETHVKCQLAFEIPVYCVWNDFTFNATQEIAAAIAIGRIRAGSFHGSGSGTPFYLVPKSFTAPWDLLVMMELPSVSAA